MPVEIVWSLLGSLVAGSLIGAEREFRGRPAGLRTHVLVCLASTLLMLAASRQGEWRLVLIPDQEVVSDPTRMAHGVLTGIGFLCAGVIFRDGFSVRGLTTAASLWMTASLGMLFGVGLFTLGAVGTALAITVLAGLRAIDHRLPRRASADVRVRYRRGDSLSEAQLRELFAGLELKPTYVSHRLIDGGEILEHATKVRGSHLRASTLAAKLGETRGVVEFEVLPHDD